MNPKIKSFLTLNLALALASCNIGNKNDKWSGDPFNIANQILTSKTKSSSEVWNSNNNLYKFINENCYAGIRNTALNTCTYESEFNNASGINKIIIGLDGINNNHQQYAMTINKAIKIGDYVYVLNTNKELWMCGFNGECNKAEGKYTQLLGVDFKSNQCSTEECKKDGEVYRSLLVLTEPTFTKYDTPDVSYYNLSSELQQIFINAGEKIGRNILSANSQKLYTVTRDNIKNDVPITEIENEKEILPGLFDLAFVMVNDNRFNIQLIYKRYKGKGNVYQMYYAGFEYGAQLIKQSISTNTNVVRKNGLNHISIFAPLAEKPIFENTLDHASMINDIRLVAGGTEDTGDYYAFCKGFNTYCDMKTNVGYSFIAGKNYFKDVINNALFFGALGVSGYGVGIVGGKIATLAEKMLASRATNRGVAALAKVAGYSLNGLNFLIPVVGVGGTLLTMQIFAKDIEKLYMDHIFSAELKLPLLSSTLQDLTSLPQNRQICRAGPHGEAICYDNQDGQCDKDLYSSLIKHEMKLREHSNTTYPESNMLGLFNDTKSCKSTPLTQEQKEIMRTVQIDNLSDFRSSTVGVVYQKLFLESSNDIVKTIDINNDEINYFESDVTLQDKEQLASDISLRIPNCQSGVCDPTYIADARGNWLTTKSGKYLSTMNGNFVEISYYRTDSNFRFPIFARIFNPNFIAPDLTYSISAYQLSDLKCDEFNAQVEKITGNDVLPVMAALRNTDHWSLIVDKNGAVCNYSYPTFKGFVNRYDSGKVIDAFMLIPLSSNPVALAVMYGINFGLGLFSEYSRLAMIEPENYPIRNAHLNYAENSIFNCIKQPLTLRAGERLQQLSQSKINPNGLWIIGDLGLHYIESGKQKFNFDFNQFATGVANSYDGKLIVSAHTRGKFRNYIDKYDEQKLLEVAAGNSKAAESYGINIDDYQEGSYNGNVGKVYTDSADNLYGVANSVNSRQGFTDLFTIWDKYYNLKGTARIFSSGLNLFKNLAINSNDDAAWVPVKENGLAGFNLKDGNFTAHKWIDYHYESGDYNPYIFNIASHYFIISDRGEVFGTDFKTSKIYKLDDKAGIPLNYPLVDAIGSVDGKFYLLTEKHMYSCKMPDRFLDHEYRYDKFKLNIINRTKNLEQIALAKQLPAGITSNAKYDMYDKEYYFNTPSNDSSSLEFNGDPGKLNLYISDLRLSTIYQGRKTLADRDYLDIKISADRKPSIVTNFITNKAYFKINEVSESELNLEAYSKGNGSGYKMGVDEQGKHYLEAINQDYTLRKYLSSGYNEQYEPLMVENNRYLINMSMCSTTGMLLFTYQELGTDIKYKVNDIAYIRQTNGRVQTITEFCQK